MTDYIIVGAGSAGCILASRLTEKPDTTVLLLEAGGPDEHPDIRIPARWGNLLQTDLDWTYWTEPQVHANNRRIILNRGKVLGGSSSINAMVYIRGHRWDYDHWTQLGAVGWSYENVLPYFKKAENQARGADEAHGVDGPVSVSDIPHESPIAPVFIEACQQWGLPLNVDFNSGDHEGVGWYQVTQKGGERHSMVDAYLRPALSRPNLAVETHAHVTRILFSGARAIGVEYIQHGQTKTAYASSEVILSGGAINSPQILLCSGVGPADQLRSLGIPVVIDLPGVGENFQDHPKVDCHFTSRPPIRADFSLTGSAYDEYQRTGAGLLSRVRSPVGAFAKTRPELSIPDMQYYAAQGDALGYYDFAIVASLLRPVSHETLALRSADPFGYPAIQANFLADAADLRTLIDSVKFVREIVHTPAFREFLDAEIDPPPTALTDDNIAAWIRSALESTWHACGTCKMGSDPLAVVTPELKVIGANNLRVIDASIMPEVVGGNTHAAVIMIAEKGADLIRGLAIT